MQVFLFSTFLPERVFPFFYVYSMLFAFVLNLEHSDFEFVSDFEFGISCFAFHPFKIQHSKFLILIPFFLYNSTTFFSLQLYISVCSVVVKGQAAMGEWGRTSEKSSLIDRIHKPLALRLSPNSQHLSFPFKIQHSKFLILIPSFLPQLLNSLNLPTPGQNPLRFSPPIYYSA